MNRNTTSNKAMTSDCLVGPTLNVARNVDCANETQTYDSSEEEEDKIVSMTSKTLGYHQNWENPEPGDLVMSTAGRLKHPAMPMGYIYHPSYLLFGRVRHFTYIDWDTGRKDAEWDGIVRDHERISVDWIEVGGIDN